MNELRYYLNTMMHMMEEPTDEEKALGLEASFKPTYLITAVKLPNGAIELAVNNVNILEKIKYILEAYDDDMCLKTNSAIQMVQMMVV